MPTIGQVLLGLLEQAERDEARLAKELEDVRLEKQGLRLAIRRAMGSDAAGHDAGAELKEPSWEPEESSADVPPAPATPAAPALPPVVQGVNPHSWTELVAGVLAEATEPLGGPDVLERLTAQGITVTSDQVRGALSYLGRKDRAFLRKRGQWILRGSPADRALQQDEIFRDVTDAPETSEPPAATGGSEVDEFEGGESETITADPVHA